MEQINGTVLMETILFHKNWGRARLGLRWSCMGVPPNNNMQRIPFPQVYLKIGLEFQKCFSITYMPFKTFNVVNKTSNRVHGEVPFRCLVCSRHYARLFRGSGCSCPAFAVFGKERSVGCCPLYCQLFSCHRFLHLLLYCSFQY